MKLQGKKIAILAENNYQEMELWYPYYRMKEEGADVSIVGTGSSSSYTSKHGYPVNVDTEARRVKAEDYDAIIIPGGYAPDVLRRYQEILRFVKEAYNMGKIVASICHGPWVLISAGVLKGKNATCFSAIKDDVINAGANYIDKEVIRDGNLITSRVPNDLPAFCRTIIEALTTG